MDAASDSEVAMPHSQNISPNPLQCPPLAAPLPLAQMSPERVNQQRVPQSPSAFLHDHPRARDSITSDVASKVAFLNSLAASSSAQSSPTRPTRAVHGSRASVGSFATTSVVNSSNALQRAVMGYEEAQASLATMTAELERCREEITMRQKRERMLAQRVEDLLEEMQQEKEKRSRDQRSYVKEVKRCRKETYRAELAAVEARQDLQESRNDLRKSQAEMAHEKEEKEKSRQEAFERAYALAGTVGEVEQLKDRLKVVEKERDAAVADNVARESAALDQEPSLDASDPPRLRRPSIDGHGHAVSALHSTSAATVAVPFPPPDPAAPTFESITSLLDFLDRRTLGLETTPEEEVAFLKQELVWARKKHAEDEDLIHFMQMQCHFQACPCREAEAKGQRFVHDLAYAAQGERHRVPKKRKFAAGGAGLAPGPVPATEARRPTLPPTIVTEAEHAPPPVVDQNPAPSLPELPPSVVPEQLSRIAEESSTLQEAIDAPLPESDPSELNSRETSLEPITQLENLTQVLIEPSTCAPFTFSTSTRSNAGPPSMVMPVDTTNNASAVALDHDLFDLSPPKHLLPRRPSTAMGILTVDSPVRLVPDPPQSVRVPLRMHPDNPRTHIRGLTTKTTTVALKDPPAPNTLHRRAQSRPNLRSHSPLASSVMSHGDEEEASSRRIKEMSASPAPNTVFPITPLHKHSRSMQDLSRHAQMRNKAQDQPRSPPQTVATATTTTRIPLRGAADVNDIFSPERRVGGHGYEHSQTEMLDVHITTRRDHGAASNNATTDANAAPPATSTSMVGNVPGTPISREAALAQIRARRDRARSVNLKRSMDEKANGGKSPTKPRPVNALFAVRDKENLVGGNGAVRREISQASAPGRLIC